MKRFSACLVLLLLVFGYTAWGENHNIVTDHKKVEGVCEQCKKRIEDAAYVKGVKTAEWNPDTRDLYLRYDSTKTNTEIILKSVAKAGHDNELFKADDADYAKQPKCCRYKTVKKH